MVDASVEGFGEGSRSAALYLYSTADINNDTIDIPDPQTPPVGPVGIIYSDRDAPGRKKLPPPRRKRKRRRVPLPPPAVPQPTPQEIEAEKQASLERVERGRADDRADIKARRAHFSLPDPNAVPAPPRIDWAAITAQLAEDQERMRAEDEAEILLMAM